MKLASGATFVLARPGDVKNIIASLHAVRAMGFRGLRIADASDEVIDETRRRLEERTGADRSETDHLEAFGTLEEAVRDESIVFGVTRRWGQRRKPVFFTPAEIAVRLAVIPRRAAIVFGNEVGGLSDAELLVCHAAVTIPSAPDCPSLNLSHAVAVVAYQIAVALSDGAAARIDEGRSRIDRRGTLDLASEVVAGLERIGYYTQAGPQGMPVFLRDLFARSALTDAESERISQAFAMLARQAKSNSSS